MKKLFLFILILGSLYSHAQSNCANAAPFCAGGASGGTFPASTGTTVGEPGPSYNCNGLQATPLSFYVPSPSWYYIQIGSSGSLSISIQGQLGTPPNTTPGGDVDFVCWGPFNSLAGICNSLTANNTVDCSYSPSYTETLSIPNAVAGQFYMVVITNFYNQPQNIALNQVGGTGSTNCALVNNSSICAGNSKTITVANTTTLTNVSYSIQPGGTTNLTGSFVVTPSATTSYTTYLTGTTGLNTQATQMSIANVTVNPQPFSAPTTTQTTCTNTFNAISLGLSFNPLAATPSYTVDWQPTPNGITNLSQTTTTGGIIPGVYNYTITAAGGCATSSFVTMNGTPLSSFNVLPVGPVYSVTCAQPTVVLTGSDASYSYTWANNVSAPMTGQTTDYTALTLGNWTVTGLNPVSGCYATKTFTVALNTSPPVSNVAPINQSINCGAGVVATATGVAISPTINVTHCWYAPGLPAPSCSGGQLSIYNPPIGTSTFVLTNDINGCSVTKTVQVVTNAGNYPTYNNVSSLLTMNAFTLGCGTRSLITDITINGANATGGGVVSYTMLPPGYIGTSYTTSPAATFSVNTPGVYALIIKDNNNSCETRIPLSVVQNTFSPNISAEAITTRTLSCFTPSIILQASSTNANVSYAWKSQAGSPPTTQSPTLIVNTTAAGASVNSATVIDTYTLTITDNVNTCTSNTVVTIYQNTRPPKGAIALSQPGLTCATYSLNLSNNSTTGVLPNTFFGNLGIGAVLWQGPPPQQDKPNVSTYSGFTAGTYTLTVQDFNNGCTAKTTTLVADNRVYPVITGTNLAVLDCGADITGTKLVANVVGLTLSQIDLVWYTPAAAKVTGEKTLTLTTNSTGDYKLSVTTKSNSCARAVNIKVIDGVLNADFTADQTSGYAPLTVNFSNNSASSSTPAPLQALLRFGVLVMVLRGLLLPMFQLQRCTINLALTRLPCLQVRAAALILL